MKKSPEKVSKPKPKKKS